jgi:HEAT repeat protein
LGEKSLEEYLQQKWLKDALKTSDVTQQQKELEELFKSGEVLLLLDGVDEMPASSPVEALAKIREELTGWVADARVVLTCRVNVWDASVNALQGFDTYRTLEFSYGDGNKPDQVREFICQWFSKAEKPELGEPLREKLDEDRHQRIRDLVKNPLRLSLLCQSWYFRQGDLPKTKAALYEQFAEAFYEWKKGVFSTTLTQREELNAALGLLAREAIDKEKSRFGIRRDFALKILGEDLFKLATEKLNWLVEVYKDAETCKPVYAFFHPTFQEYFAACAIDNWHFFLNHIAYNPVEGTYRIFEQQWKEVILLWLGQENLLKEQKEAFIKALVEFDGGYGYGNEKFYEYRAYFLAAAGISELGECSLVDKIVKQVVKWSFGEFNFKYQAMQYEVSFQVADVAKATLLETDYHRAIPILIELSQTTLPERALHQVLECLEKIGTGNPEVRVMLIDLIDKSHDEQIIIKAAESLEKIDPGNAKVIVTLLNLIHNSADEFICFRASDDLWRIAPDHPEAIEVVDAEPNLFLEVAKSEQIDLNNPKVIEWLVHKVRSSPNNERDKSNRIKVVEALGYIIPGNSEAIKALIDLIHTTTNEVLFRQAVRSLGRIGKGDPKAIAVLIELICNSQDWLIHSVAVQGLRHAETSYIEAIGVLIDLICNSSDENIQIQAADSLGQILQRHPSASAVSALKDCLVTPFYEKDCDLYLKCDDVLWYCAQTMPYPDFYQAWHGEPSPILVEAKRDRHIERFVSPRRLYPYP